MNAPLRKGQVSSMSTRDDWDYENAEIHEPEREVKSVYSLRFTATEIAEIRAAAEREGVTTSEFIRTAARSRAKTQAVPAEIVKALALALVNISERYELAGAAEGKRGSVEDLASWLNEQALESRSA